MHIITATATSLLIFAAQATAVCEDKQEVTEPRVLEVDGRRLHVWSLSEYLAKSEVPYGSETPYSPTYFAHVAGIPYGMFPGDPTSNSFWHPVRTTPIRENAAPSRIGAMRGQSLWFRRPVQKKHATLLQKILGDWAPPYDEEFGKEERLHLVFLDLEGCPTSPEISKGINEKYLLFRYVAVPVDERLESLSEGILFESDWEATAFCGNIRVIARMNYTDIRDRDRLLQELQTNAPFLAAVVHAKSFLERPFPTSDKIVYKNETKLIRTFGIEEETLKVGEPVVVDLSFGIQALHMSELIRLKATSGGFQRQGADILYRPDEPGTHILTLEAFCGFQHDGKVNFAERREIEVTVVEE